MRIGERVIIHKQNEIDFSRRFNTNLPQAIEVINNDDPRALKCLNITGKLYGIDHIEFTKNSGSTWSHRTSLPYTLSALEEENRRIDQLISDFKQDLQDVSNEEEFEIIQSSINELASTVEQLNTLFKCVLTGYSSEIKKQQHGDNIELLKKSVELLGQNLKEVQNLEQRVIGTKEYRRNQAKEFFENIKQLILTIDCQEEKNNLANFRNSADSFGDIKRCTITVGNNTFRPSGQDEQLLKNKLDALRMFSGNDSQLFDQIIRTFHQGMAGPLTILLAKFNEEYFATGDSMAQDGLKRFDFQRDEVTQEMKITFYTTFPILDMKDNNQFMCRINGTITATLPIDELREGNLSNMDLKYSWKMAGPQEELL